MLFTDEDRPAFSSIQQVDFKNHKPVCARLFLPCSVVIRRPIHSLDIPSQATKGAWA